MQLINLSLMGPAVREEARHNDTTAAFSALSFQYNCSNLLKGGAEAGCAQEQGYWLEVMSTW